LLGKRRFYLFSIKGIPIKVDVSWGLIFILVTWSLSSNYFPGEIPGISKIIYYILGGVTAILLFLSILLHELGHSLVALKMGIPIHEITLFVFGGVAQMEEEPEDSIDQFKIAVAGPLVSLTLSLLFLIFFLMVSGISTLSPLKSIFKYLSIINLMIMIFNLAPGLPLDGGRILMAFLWRFTGDLLKASKISSLLGRGIGGLMALGGFFLVTQGLMINGLWFIVIGLFLANSARMSYENIRMFSLLSRASVADAMTRQIITVPSTVTIQQLASDYFAKHSYLGYPVVKKISLPDQESHENISRTGIQGMDRNLLKRKMRIQKRYQAMSHCLSFS